MENKKPQPTIEQLHTAIEVMAGHQAVHQARLQANESVLMCLIDRLDPRLIQGLLEAVQKEYRRTKLDSMPDPEELLQWSPVLRRIQEAASRVGKAPT